MRLPKRAAGKAGTIGVCASWASLSQNPQDTTFPRMFRPPPATPPAAKKKVTPRASQTAAEQQPPPTLVLQLQAPTEPEQNGVPKTKPSQQASPLPAPDGTQEDVKAAQAEKMRGAVEEQNASNEEQATTTETTTKISPAACDRQQLSQEKLEQGRLAQKDLNEKKLVLLESMLHLNESELQVTCTHAHAHIRRT